MPYCLTINRLVFLALCGVRFRALFWKFPFCGYAANPTIAQSGFGLMQVDEAWLYAFPLIDQRGCIFNHSAIKNYI